MASNYNEKVQQTIGHYVEQEKSEGPVFRLFDTGATRTSEANKPDYEGFISPLVVMRYGEYMNKHRVQPDGEIRDSDNWQLGIPKSSYMKSGWRHFLDWWLAHRKKQPVETLEDALCALIFNASGYLTALLQERGYRA